MTERPPPDVLREAARDDVAEKSLRSVAREIGMSAPGLQAFLDGGSPYRRTLRKLRDWYVRRGAGGPGVEEETAHAAFAVLVDRFPSRARTDAARELASTLTRLFSRHRLPPPDWLREDDLPTPWRPGGGGEPEPEPGGDAGR